MTCSLKRTVAMNLCDQQFENRALTRTDKQLISCTVHISSSILYHEHVHLVPTVIGLHVSTTHTIHYFLFISTIVLLSAHNLLLCLLLSTNTNH